MICRYLSRNFCMSDDRRLIEECLPLVAISVRRHAKSQSARGCLANNHPRIRSSKAPSTSRASARRGRAVPPLGIETVGDLLFHFPRAYEDLTDVRRIAALSAGKTQTVQGEVVEIEGKRAGRRPDRRQRRPQRRRQALPRRRLVQSAVRGAAASATASSVAFSGKPKWYRDHWQMSNPRVQIARRRAPADAPSIVPVYPLTEDLRAEQLRAADAPGGRAATPASCPRCCPPSCAAAGSCPTVAQALRDVHFPEALAEAQAGRRRFVYEEFLVLQLALAPAAPRAARPAAAPRCCR